MVTFFGDADIQPILDTLGVPVTVGVVTAKGLRDQPDEERLRGEGAFVRDRVTTVLVRTKTFEGVLARNVTITVESVAYKIGDMEQEGLDGAVTRILCVKVAK